MSRSKDKNHVCHDNHKSDRQNNKSTSVHTSNRAKSNNQNHKSKLIHEALARIQQLDEKLYKIEINSERKESFDGTDDVLGSCETKGDDDYYDDKKVLQFDDEKSRNDNHHPCIDNQSNYQSSFFMTALMEPIQSIESNVNNPTLPNHDCGTEIESKPLSPSPNKETKSSSLYNQKLCFHGSGKLSTDIIPKENLQNFDTEEENLVLSSYDNARIEFILSCLDYHGTDTKDIMSTTNDDCLNISKSNHGGKCQIYEVEFKDYISFVGNDLKEEMNRIDEKLYQYGTLQDIHNEFMIANHDDNLSSPHVSPDNCNISCDTSFFEQESLLRKINDALSQYSATSFSPSSTPISEENIRQLYEDAKEDLEMEGVTITHDFNRLTKELVLIQ